MQKILVVNKPPGMTPLEAIKKIRSLKPELTDKKISYAGRLDPLASGLLLLLMDDETRNREKYLSLPKTYEFEAIFGVQTDTYDFLGLLTEKRIKKPEINVNIFVNSFVNKSIGRLMQPFPPYSSKTVKGKPLFLWAKEDKLGEIEIPSKEIEIYNFTCLGIGEIALDDVKQKVNKAITSVKGDFRQEEIKQRWDKFFMDTKNQTLETAKFRISCSSGTYVRELVNQMGEELNCGAISIDILRTKVGDFTLKDAINL